MRARILTIVATGAFAVAGAGGAAPAASADCSTAQSASEQHLGQPTVEIAAGGLVQGDNFAPCNVTISAGTTVHWTITPSGNHTVTADSSAPSSFDFSGGGGSFNFSQAGTYFYYCMFHGTSGAPGTGMNGVVYVQGPGGTPPPASAPPKFSGVKLASHAIRVTAKRIAGVRVRCPAGTTGSCQGRLTLTAGGGTAARLATKSLSIPAGQSATVKLRLSTTEFRKLVKRRKLKLGVAIEVHDGNGTASGQPNESITLKAPPKR
jgi:plastocyanin